MKVLLIRPGPQFSVADVARGWKDALLNLGVQVGDFNFDDRLNFYAGAHIEKDGQLVQAMDTESAIRVAAKGIEAEAYHFWPEVVMIVSGFFVPPETYRLLRARGKKIVLLCTESPYEDDRQLRYAAHVDVVLLNDPTNIEKFRAVNPNTHYVPHAYDPKIHRRRNARSSFASDFCFVGTGYPSRIEFFEKCDWTGIDVALAGNWQALDESSPLRKFVTHPLDQCLPNDQAIQMYSSTKVSANLYRKEAERSELEQGWAMGPREVELAASHTFFIREPRPESDDVLWMLPTFDSPEDLVEKTRWFLDHGSQRNELAEQAFKAVRDRTFDAHAKWLLQLLSG